MIIRSSNPNLDGARALARKRHDVLVKTSFGVEINGFGLWLPGKLISKDTKLTRILQSFQWRLFESPPS